MIATSSLSESKKLALEAGADAFISKSDTPERMLETIKSVII
jgi:DNA-binding NarL/FixJ family response regulator